MKKDSSVTGKKRGVPRSLPLVIEKDESGGYVIECPVLPGCYTQGETYEEALKNIQEVIELVLEEEDSRAMLQEYAPKEIIFHTITI